MLARSRYTECLRLIATVPGNELDAVARLCHLGRRVVRGMYQWTRKQLQAVLSLVRHGHLTGPWLASAYVPTIDPFELVASPFGIVEYDDQQRYDDEREYDAPLEAEQAHYCPLCGRLIPRDDHDDCQCERRR